MGRVTSLGTMGTEVAALITHRLYRPDGTKRGVIACHGLNARAWHYVNNNDPVVDELARRGYPVLCPELGGVATWGNDAAQTKLADARTYLQSAAVGAKAGGVLLWCVSMGTLLGLNYLRNNPTHITALADTLPATDLIDLHDNAAARSLNATNIEAAYGGTAGYNAARASHNPAENTAALSAYSNRIALWYSADDPTTIPALPRAFAAATGCKITNMGNQGGHVFDTKHASAVVDWLESFG